MAAGVISRKNRKETVCSSLNITACTVGVQAEGHCTQSGSRCWVVLPVLPSEVSSKQAPWAQSPHEVLSHVVGLRDPG